MRAVVVDVDVVVVGSRCECEFNSKWRKKFFKLEFFGICGFPESDSRKKRK